MIDLIVEEFRAYRQAHAAQYNNDLDAICEALRAEEAVSGAKFVRGKLNPSVRDGLRNPTLQAAVGWQA